MTLWVKFAGDTSLPPVLDEEGQRRLEQIFNGLDPNSPLHQSMAALGLELPLAPMLQWQESAPYINWTAIIDTISGGWVTAYGENDYKIRKSPVALLRFLKIQFRISLYLARALKAEIPSSPEKQIVESLSLGFASLALTFRLPREPQLAELLARPPANLRKTLAQIQSIQLRRTKLTPAWQALFPWREEAEDASAFSENYEGRKDWQGIPISGGQVTACLHLQQTESNEPVVYAFKRARPETVELFPVATAILYGEGGAMSHACTVAREMNLTCVTALGPDFYRDMQALAASQKNVWLIIDGQTGKVGLVN